jgi:hypothetical protein
MQFSSVLHLHRKSIKLVLECGVFVTFPSFLKSDYQLRRFIESSTKLFSFRVFLEVFRFKLLSWSFGGLELLMTTFGIDHSPLHRVCSPLTSSIICGRANIPSCKTVSSERKFSSVCIMAKTLKIDKTREVSLFLPAYAIATIKHTGTEREKYDSHTRAAS